MNISVTPEQEQHIFQTAERLQAETGKRPTISQVRAAAQVSMTAAAAVMRKWKQQNKESAEITVPEPIQQAGIVFVANLWKQAEDIATQATRAAQSAWEQEKEEMDQLLVEVGIELEQAQEELKDKVEENAGLLSENQTLKQDQASLRSRLESAEKQLESTRSELNELKKTTTQKIQDLIENQGRLQGLLEAAEKIAH